ncbi:MAG: hypothetical protein RIR50_496 [Pseudomonadota bacterium]
MLKRLLQRLFGKKPQSSYEIELTSSVGVSQAPVGEVTSEVKNEVTAPLSTPALDYPIPVEDISDLMCNAPAHQAFIRWRTTSGGIQITHES